MTLAPSGSNIFVEHGPGPDTTFGAFFGARGSDFDRISQAFATTPGAFYTLSFFYQVTDIGMPAPPSTMDSMFSGTAFPLGEASFLNSTYNRALVRLRFICKPPAP